MVQLELENVAESMVSNNRNLHLPDKCFLFVDSAPWIFFEFKSKSAPWSSFWTGVNWAGIESTF